MKSTEKNERTIFSLVMTVAVICLMTAVIIPGVMGATSLNLLTSGDYAILTQTGITGGAGSTITGDIGSSLSAADGGITGFALTGDPANGYMSSIYVPGGKVYAFTYSAPTPTNLGIAVGAMQAAYTSTSAQATDVLDAGSAGDIGGLVLAPGVYRFDIPMHIYSDVTLDAQGDTNAVWIFQTPGTFDTGANTNVILTNGAQSQNVFWVVADTTSIGANSVLYGNILDQTNIAFGSAATLHGRALAQTAVTLLSDVVDSTNVQAPVVPVITAPTFVSAVTNVTGDKIIVTFNNPMNNPAGKETEFTYNVGGSDQPFSAAALNTTSNKKIDLTTGGTSILPGDPVTISYTAGTVTAVDTGVLATFINQPVANTMPAAPTFSSAVTNVTGNKIIVTFNKAMSSPVGKETEFAYQIGGGADQPFDTAVLNATNNKAIDLTTAGTQIASGNTVTVSYTAGTVTAADTGVLATFATQPVTNTIPAPPTVSSAVTNVTGDRIIITFNKAMSSPVGKETEFAYQIGGGLDQPFSSAVLNATNNKAIDLTTAGTQIASGDGVTVSYTAGTVTAADTGVLATFATQPVSNDVIAGIIPPTVTSSTTNVTGNKIIITFDKAMSSPVGKETEFAYQIGGGADQPFDTAVLNATNNKAIDLTTAGTQIASGNTVTVSYTAGTVTAANTGVLATFATQPVNNAVVAGIPAPSVTSAETNAAGTMITITFDKVMDSPAGKAGAFKYQIGSGTDQPFDTAVLNATDNKAIDLTTFGTSIAYGDVVTINYTAGTVTSADTGVLATFTGHAVTNTMPAPPAVTGILSASGLITGGETVTITGTGLLGATTVTFDTIAVIPMTNTGTVITVSAPAHTAGIVNVTVTTPVGTSANSSVNKYSYGIPGSSALDLGTADNFVILAKSGISTTGPTSIYGDIGVSPIAASGITGFNLVADASNQFSRSSLVNGNVYASNYAVPTPVTMTTAISDMEAAYNDAAGRTLPDHTELGGGDIGGMTLAPGLYKWSTGVTIPTDVTLSGGPNDVWIFQIAQGLVISSDKHVILSGGAQAKNIYWQVAGQTTLGSDSVFEGTILDKTLIAFDSGAALNGKALAQTAVTLIGNNVNVPAVTPVVTPVITVGPIENRPNGGSGEPDTGTSTGSASAANAASDLLAPPGQLSPSLPSSDTPVNGGGTLTSTPLIVDFSGMTGVTVSWTTQISDNPAPNAEITTAIQPNAGQSTLDAISAALHLGGLDTGSPAYGMVIQKNGVVTYGPTTVTMSVSQDWVTRNGGNDAMRIIRIADDGTVEVLHTWFGGYDSYSGYPTFKATSPQGGLGTSFWLVSVNPYTPPTPTAAPVTGQKAPTQAPVTSTTPAASTGGVPLMMTIGGIFAALVIVGIATMTVIRRIK